MVPKILNREGFFSDKYAIQILKSTSVFKSVSEISHECNIPLMSAYRRVKSLHKFGFLEIRGYLINGVRFAKYKRTNISLYGKNPRITIILKLISENPGIRFSELQKSTGFPHGTLSHCLSKIISEHKIIAKRFGRRTWFFSPQIESSEFETIILLRKETTKKILIFLLEKRTATFKEIRDEIKKSPSTTSWALTSLIEASIIRRVPGNPVKYILINEKNTFETIKNIEPSIADSLKERFADTFSYL